MASLLPCLLFVWLPIATAYYTYTACDDCTDRATTNDLKNISLVYFTNDTLDVYESVFVEDAADLVDLIDLTKPTVFYIFGWTENITSLSTKTVAGALLTRGDDNVIVVDWSNISEDEYLFAFLSIGGIGWIAAQAWDSMIDAGMDSTTSYIIGHSLGGQIAGYIGKYANNTVPKITGLDPAGPGFYLIEDCLKTGDAEFVEVIHTDAGVYGTAITDVDVNFFPNGGIRLQPGCTLSIPMSDNDYCSHHRSWYYYAESVLNEKAFQAKKCLSIFLWLMDSCSDDETTIMGYAASNNLTGHYYLQTNSASPFGRETKGSTFNSTLYLGTL